VLFRLAAQLRCLDLRRYEHAARSIDGIGRLVGAWTKAHAAHADAPQNAATAA
jgi:hypothetical protein